MLYVSVFAAQYPSRALELLGYQRIITMAAKRFPTGLAWLRYDSNFESWQRGTNLFDGTYNTHTCGCNAWAVAASHRHPATPMVSSRSTRVPCTYCGSTSHFPDNCPRNPFRVPEPRGTGAAPSTAPKSRPTQPQPQPPPAFGNQVQPQACRDYNNNKCFRGSKCVYPHVCTKCGGTHTYVDCPWRHSA